MGGWGTVVQGKFIPFSVQQSQGKTSPMKKDRKQNIKKKGKIKDVWVE